MNHKSNASHTSNARDVRSARGPRVIKLGGRAQTNAKLAPLLAAAAATQPLVVVHGGGDEVSALQRRLGLEPVFVGGRRVTSERDLEVVRIVLSGSVNKRLVAALVTAGVRAVGVSGEDGALLTGRIVDPTFGRVGREVEANPALLHDLLSAGWLPVVSPLARDRESVAGEGLNVNGDDAATAIATALGAAELLFVSDVEGVLVDGFRVPRLDPPAIRDLAGRGEIQGGMLAKLEAAVTALEAGVGAVRIGLLDAIADQDAGTIIVPAVPVPEDHP